MGGGLKTQERALFKLMWEEGAGIYWMPRDRCLLRVSHLSPHKSLKGQHQPNVTTEEPQRGSGMAQIHTISSAALGFTLPPKLMLLPLHLLFGVEPN